MKRKWLQQLMLTEVTQAALNPHRESEYLIAIGDMIGVVEHDAATQDRLISSSNVKLLQQNRTTLYDKFTSFITVDEIVNAMFDALRVSTEHAGLNMDDESIVIQAEIKSYLETHDMYNPSSYDEDGNINKDTVIKILITAKVLLSEVATPKTALKVAELGVGPAASGTSLDLFSTILTPSSCTNPIEAEELMTSRSVSFDILLSQLPLQLRATISVCDLTAASALKVAVNLDSAYFVSFNITGPEPVKGFLEELLQIRWNAQPKDNVLPSLYWVDSKNVDTMQSTLTADLCRCCLHCPTCNAELGMCVTNLLPCTNSQCIGFFTDSKIGKWATKILQSQPRVMELLISMAYWSGSAGLKSHPPSQVAANASSAGRVVPTPAAQWKETVADMDFNPFPRRFLESGSTTGARRYVHLLETLNRLPTADMLKDLVDSDRLDGHFAEDYMVDAGYVLHWIANYAPNRLEYIPQQSMNAWERNFMSSRSGSAKHLFRINNPPEKVALFEAAKKSFGGQTEFLFHGSAPSKWFSILRNSLMVCSGTNRMINGAVYGNGIYLGKTFEMSLGYSTKHNANNTADANSGFPPEVTTLIGSGWWNCSMYISWCVLVVECVKSSKCQNTSGERSGIIVATTSDAVISRYIVCG